MVLGSDGYSSGAAKRQHDGDDAGPPADRVTAAPRGNDPEVLPAHDNGKVSPCCSAPLAASLCNPKLDSRIHGSGDRLGEHNHCFDGSPEGECPE